MCKVGDEQRVQLLLIWDGFMLMWRRWPLSKVDIYVFITTIYDEHANITVNGKTT